MNDLQDRKLDASIRTALGHIVDHAPVPPRTARREITAARANGPKRVWLAAAAVPVAAAGVVGMVALSRRDDGGPAAAPTVAIVPAALEPCGTVFPVDVDLPNFDATPTHGPAALIAPADGQLIQHWVVQQDKLEVRWPPDPRPLYDVSGGWTDIGVSSERDEQGVLDFSFDVVVGLGETDNPYTLRLTPSTDATSTAGCDRLQVRFIDIQGRTSTYSVSFSDTGAPEIRTMNPLIVSTEKTADPTDASAVTPCFGQPNESGSGGPTAATPAEALIAFLEVNEPWAEGYRELVVNGGESYVYVRYYDSSLTQHYTVEPFDGGWAVTDWTTSAC